MQFKPGDLYNRTDHNLTLNRLINLDQFRYVKNRFEVVEDTAKLDVYYYLTPLQRQALLRVVLPVVLAPRSGRTIRDRFFYYSPWDTT